MNYQRLGAAWVTERERDTSGAGSTAYAGAIGADRCVLM